MKKLIIKRAIRCMRPLSLLPLLVGFSYQAFASEHVAVSIAAKTLPACTSTGRILSQTEDTVQCGNTAIGKITYSSGPQSKDANKLSTDVLISMYAPYQSSFTNFVNNVESVVRLLKLSKDEETALLSYLQGNMFADKPNQLDKIGSITVLRPTAESSQKYGNYLLEIMKED